MAAAALQNAAAAKLLSDSTRQLRQYLSGDNLQRILVQKADKVDLDLEELLARHRVWREI